MRAVFGTESNRRWKTENVAIAEWIAAAHACSCAGLLLSLYARLFPYARMDVYESESSAHIYSTAGIGAHPSHKCSVILFFFGTEGVFSLIYFSSLFELASNKFYTHIFL